MVYPVTGAPLRFLVLVVKELLAKLGDYRIAQCIGDDGVRDVEAFLVGSGRNASTCWIRSSFAFAWLVSARAFANDTPS